MRNAARIACSSCAARTRSPCGTRRTRPYSPHGTVSGSSRTSTTFHDSALYLASEIKALFVAGVPAHWDHESFCQIGTGPQMSDRTLFDGVYQMPRGHYLTATTNGMRILR